MTVKEPFRAEHFERFGKAIDTRMVSVDLPLLIGKLLGWLLSGCCLSIMVLGKGQSEG